jgi:hypothetical protein
MGPVTDEYGFELVDVYRRYTPFPFQLHAGDLPALGELRETSGILCGLSTHRRGRLFMAFVKRCGGIVFTSW